MYFLCNYRQHTRIGLSRYTTYYIPAYLFFLLDYLTRFVWTINWKLILKSWSLLLGVMQTWPLKFLLTKFTKYNKPWCRLFGFGLMRYVIVKNGLWCDILFQLSHCGLFHLPVKHCSAWNVNSATLLGIYSDINQSLT